VRYLNIARACRLIALDNGGINRDRSIEKQFKQFTRWLKRQPESDDILFAIDEWLDGLSRDDLETVCCGEHTEGQAILASAPPFTDDLLNRYFDEVC